MTFIFIGRGRRTPSKSGYKQTLQIKSNLIRITQDQTGLTGRPSALPILAANMPALPFAGEHSIDADVVPAAGAHE